jgi:hypothetical protein
MGHRAHGGCKLDIAGNFVEGVRHCPGSGVGKLRCGHDRRGAALSFDNE